MGGRKKKNTDRAVYGLRRVDNDTTRTHGYIVCIQRRGRIWRRSFSDGVHGGKAKALRAAKAFRDGIVAANPPLSRAAFAAIKRRNNLSGTPGICRYVWIDRGRDKPVERPYWIAFWSGTDNKRITRKFSIDKYGEKGARQRALAARRRALKVLDRPFVNSEGFRDWLDRHPEPRRAPARSARSRKAK